MIDIHVCKDDKVIGSLIQLYQNWFPVENNPFLVLGTTPYNFNYGKYPNVERMVNPRKNIFALYKKMRDADRVHLHGLFSFEVIVILALSRKIGKKSMWYIMGDDLYRAARKSTSLPGKLHMFFRTRAVRNLGMISTNIKGDYELAKKYFKCNPEFYRIYPGSMNLGIYDSIKKTEKAAGAPLRILLGNSATATNRHEDAFRLLSKYKNENIEIYAPLSYGNKDYGDRIEAAGKEIFGDKFIAMRDFMDRDKYMDFLGTVDIAVFAHDRQQAVGNIMPLLYLGKKVYISHNISTCGYLVDENDIKVYSYENIENESFEDLCRVAHTLEEQKKRIAILSDEERSRSFRSKTLISEN